MALEVIVMSFQMDMKLVRCLLSCITDPPIYDECSEQSNVDDAPSVQKMVITFLNGNHVTDEHVLGAGSELIDVSLPRSGG